MPLDTRAAAAFNSDYTQQQEKERGMIESRKRAFNFDIALDDALEEELAHRRTFMGKGHTTLSDLVRDILRDGLAAAKAARAGTATLEQPTTKP